MSLGLSGKFLALMGIHLSVNLHPRPRGHRAPVSLGGAGSGAA